MSHREDRPPPGGSRRQPSRVGGALLTAAAALVLEVWAQWQAGGWRLRVHAERVEQLGMASLVLALVLLGLEALRARRLVRGLESDAAERRREVAALREAAFAGGGTPATGELPLLLFTLDPNGRFDRFNPRWLEVLGCSEAELRGTRFADLLPADQLATWRDLERQILSGSPAPRFQISLLARGGEPIFIEGSAWPRPAPEPAGIAGSLVDVTAHRLTERARARAESALRRSEEALHESEMRYRNIFENGLGFLCTHDLEGRLLSINPAAAGALGFRADELVGRSLADLLAPSVRDGLVAYLESIRRGAHAEGLMRLATRQGEKRFWMYRNVVHSPLGGAPYVLGFAFDVTDSWRARSAVAASERRFRQFLEASGDLIQSLDAEGRLEYVNRQWRETLGYSEKEARALHFADFVVARELPHCAALFERLRSGDPSGLVETVFLARDGREVLVHGTVSSSFDEGRFVSCQGFFRDVTRSKMLEEQRRAYLDQIQQQNLELELNRKEAVRANRLKSEFLAMMSHELRTPLNAIVGFSGLLAEDPLHPLGEKQGFYLGFVRKAAEHLLRLINDILDLSKIEAGRLKLSPEDLRVAALLPEVLSTIGPLAAQKRIHLDPRVPEELSVFADRLHFKQILFNLLSNAVKFTPAGGTITVAGQSEPGFSLLLVSNTGSSIDPAEHEAIFDEFQQARGRAERREGTGLGLAIVRRLVEQHGGRAWVESSPSTDTTFAILLPDRQELAAAAPPNPPSLPRAQRSAGEPAILLLSDDEAARERWAEVLRGQQFSVRAAGCDGLSAARIESGQPQLTLLDLASTGARGWQLLRELSERGRIVKPLVLALVPDFAGQRAAFLAGAHGCVVLPAEDGLLVKACRRRLEPFDAPRVVLIVEPERERQRLLTEAAIAAGFRPVVVAAGRDALHTAETLRPQAVVLDLQLPDLDGYQTIVRLRSNPATAQIPVLVLTQKSADAVETQAFTGPTRLLFLPDDDWRDFVTVEIQRTVDAERWLASAGGNLASGRP